VAHPLRLNEPWRVPAVDWEATLAFRRHLWALGFKIAEAMDTSQRGMGLDWPTAAELIARALSEAKATPGADLACGAGTDQLVPDQARGLDDVIRAYEAQIEHVEKHGGKVILMASRALCHVARLCLDRGSIWGRRTDRHSSDAIRYSRTAQGLAGHPRCENPDRLLSHGLRRWPLRSRRLG